MDKLCTCNIITRILDYNKYQSVYLLSSCHIFVLFIVPISEIYLNSHLLKMPFTVV